MDHSLRCQVQVSAIVCAPSMNPPGGGGGGGGGTARPPGDDLHQLRVHDPQLREGPGHVGDALPVERAEDLGLPGAVGEAVHELGVLQLQAGHGVGHHGGVPPVQLVHDLRGAVLEDANDRLRRTQLGPVGTSGQGCIEYITKQHSPLDRNHPPESYATTWPVSSHQCRHVCKHLEG